MHLSDEQYWAEEEAAILRGETTEYRAIVVRLGSREQSACIDLLGRPYDRRFLLPLDVDCSVWRDDVEPSADGPEFTFMISEGQLLCLHNVAIKRRTSREDVLRRVLLGVYADKQREPRERVEQARALDLAVTPGGFSLL